MNTQQKQSGFYLLSDNIDAFVARFALATIATKTLDIQYYIIHNDASGQYLAYAILQAADRGVKVRILVDDINLSGRDIRLKMLSQHDNIEIRIFNPLSNRDWFRNLEMIVHLDRAGRRMHNKVFVADNAAAIIGGRNIGDEYFDNRNDLNFVDLDVLTIGPIVDDIGSSFDDYWNSCWATPVEQVSRRRVVKKQLSTIRAKLRDRWQRARNSQYFNSIQQSDLTKKIISREIPFVWADARFFYDRPEKLTKSEPERTVHLGPHVLPFFESAQHELLIASPYFIPGKEGLAWFKKMRSKLTTLKVLTNSLAATDVIAVHAGYKKYRKRLLKAGVELFELKPTARQKYSKTKKFIQGSSTASLHAKYMIVDRHYVFIGSANLDPRSQLLNTEIGIMVDSPELARQASELYEKTISKDNSYRLSFDGKLTWLGLKDDTETIYTSDPKAGLFRRIGVFLLSLLPFESLL
jgi:putative cardiolipin synthase